SVEIIVAVALNVWRANTCIAHNGRGASWFNRCTGTLAIVVLGVISAILVAHFVGYIINIKRIVNRCRQSGNASRLLAGNTRYAKSGDTTAASTEYVANIIIGIADYAIQRRLVLGEHGKPVIVGIWIGSCI